MSSPTHKNYHLIALISGLFIVVVVMFFTISAMDGHTVSMVSLSSITSSSTEVDVRVLLGKPTEVGSRGDGLTWRYTSYTWCIVTIMFGADGKVVFIDHDH